MHNGKLSPPANIGPPPYKTTHPTLLLKRKNGNLSSCSQSLLLFFSILLLLSSYISYAYHSLFSAYNSRNAVLPFQQALPRLALIFPFVTHNTSITLKAIEKWGSAGSPCSRTNSVGVHFLQNKVDDDRFDTTEFYNTITSQTLFHSYKSCFSSITIENARLTGAEDVYPAGPSYMFWNIFKAPHLSHLKSQYDFFFWAEWDVYPIRPLWVDALFHEITPPADFWMRGSLLKGSQLDPDVAVRENADWAPHINGNALYKLNDGNFEKFLDIVFEYEPPGHYWKPFDISIWRVLHSFPYSWRLYQRFRPMFQHRNFIAHFGFSVSPEHVRLALQSDDIYFIHGNPRSAGLVMYEKKFSDAAGLKRAKWDDSISLKHNISIFIRTFGADAPFADIAIDSVLKYAPEVVEIVVVAPAADRLLFVNWSMRPKVVVYYEKKLFENDRLQQKYSKLYADRYCKGAYILHLDSDTPLFRTLQYRDLFYDHKPIAKYYLYKNLPKAAKFWEKGTAGAVGKVVGNEYSRSGAHVYPREIYKRARRHLETRYNTSVRNFLKTRIASIFDFQSKHMTNASLNLAFSDFNYIGAYLWYFDRDAMWWRPSDSVLTIAEEFPSPVVPTFICQGTSQFARLFEQTSQHANAMRLSVDNGNCGSIETHYDVLVRVVKKRKVKELTVQ